jgi:glutathione S-transferase
VAELLADSNVRLLALVDLLLVLMMMTVGNYTSLLRIRHKVFAAAEDYGRRPSSNLQGPDEVVERVRRVHLNHLENVLPFIVVSLFYVLTRPSYAALSVFLWGFLLARVSYSVFYLRALQPHRTIAFGLAMGLMFAMIVSTLIALI